MSTQSARIEWVLSGDRTKASSRLQGFLIHEWLVRQGVSSHVAATDFNRIGSIWSRAFIDVASALSRSAATHVVFEAPEWPMVTLARLCSRQGKRVLAVRCDRIPERFDEYFDATILPTEGLRQALGVERGIVIDDACEVPEGLFKRDYRQRGGKLKVGWVGHSGYRDYIVDFVARLRKSSRIDRDFEFELISSGDFATRQWSIDGVFADVLACDIAILPLPSGEWFQNKSSNRLIMMHALGMPVIASLIPSYRALARHGANGLYVGRDDEFETCLETMRNPERREALGTQARHDLGSRYALQSIGAKWQSAIIGTCAANPDRLRPNPKLLAFNAMLRLL